MSGSSNSQFTTALHSNVGEEIFSAWFGCLQFDHIEGPRACLTVPTKFLRKWLREHYTSQILEAMQSEFPEVTEISIGLRGAAALQKARVAAPAPAVVIHAPPNIPEEFGWLYNQELAPTSSFSNFIVYPGNCLAHALAYEKGRPNPLQRSSPLYLWSDVGLGKTHLLQSIAKAAKLNGRRSVYLTSQKFMYSFVDLFRTTSCANIHQFTKETDIILIDDVQLLNGRFFRDDFQHLLDEWIGAGIHVVVAADCQPRLLSINERLVSRLNGGVCVEIRRPDLEARINLLNRFVSSMNGIGVKLDVPQNVVEHIAKTLASNCRDLEGAINRLVAHACGPVSIETADIAIQDLTIPLSPPKISVESIIKTVALHCGVEVDDILSRRRRAAVVRTRHMCMYLVKILTRCSYPDIGRQFAGRDHTTALYAVRKIKRLIAEDPGVAAEIATLKECIR
jgi:chromosomal replication initiator protein